MNQIKTVGRLKRQLENIGYSKLIDFVNDQEIIDEHKWTNAQLALSEFAEQVSEVASLPLFYNIEVTNQCNLHCTFCPTGKRDKNINRGYIDFEFYKNLIDQIADHAIAVSLVNWGEPTLYKDCVKCIQYAKEKNIFVYVSTNASIDFSEGYWDEFLNSGVDCLHLDLDGMTQESYEKYRRGGRIKSVKKNIEKICSIKQKYKTLIEVAMIAMKHNEQQIPEFLLYCEKLGVDRAIVGKLQAHPQYVQTWLPDNPEYKYMNYYEQDTKGPGFCPRLYFHMVINWDGQVAPCCLTYGDVNNIGHAKSSSLKLIWNNEQFQSSRSIFSKYPQPCSTICNYCRNNLGSWDIPRYEDTLALSKPS